MPIVSQKFQSIWMGFGKLLKPVRLMNLILILRHLFNIQMRAPYSCDFVKKNKQTNKKKNKQKHRLVFKHLQTAPVSFKCPMTIEIQGLHFDISLDDLDHHSGSQLYKKLKKKKKSVSILSQIWNRFGWKSVCCYNMLICWSPWWIHFARLIFKGENSAVKRFVSNAVWNQTLVNSTVRFQFEWIWCWSKVTGLRESQNFLSHSVVKFHETTQMFHETTQMFVTVDYVSGMAAKIREVWQMWIVWAFALFWFVCLFLVFFGLFVSLIVFLFVFELQLTLS